MRRAADQLRERRIGRYEPVLLHEPYRSDAGVWARAGLAMAATINTACKATENPVATPRIARIRNLQVFDMKLPYVLEMLQASK